MHQGERRLWDVRPHGLPDPRAAQLEALRSARGTQGTHVQGAACLTVQALMCTPTRARLTVQALMHPPTRAHAPTHPAVVSQSKHSCTHPPGPGLTVQALMHPPTRARLHIRRRVGVLGAQRERGA